MTKKKRGRKKKRGPKKRLAPKVYRGPNTWDYKIVACRNGRQVKYIGNYPDIKQAYAEVDRLKKENKEVILPKRVIQRDRVTSNVGEYLLLERNKGGKDESPLLRNEFGKLIPHKTNTAKWVILDKFKWVEEETFWVYGYDPKRGRKTFLWVYENVIAGQITSKYDVKRIILYNNKVIIKHDNADIDIIFCKNKSEAIRFYNHIEEFAKRDHYDQIFFVGEYGFRNPKTTKLIDELCEYTGWDRRKITRVSTST
jgi:hypothetical protein